MAYDLFPVLEVPQTTWSELKLSRSWHRCIGVCRLLVHLQELRKEDLRHGNPGRRLCVLCGLFQMQGVQEADRGFAICQDVEGALLYVVPSNVDEEEEEVRTDEAGKGEGPAEAVAQREPALCQ